MITSTTTHNISIENICTEDKRKGNNFINNQILKFQNDTIVIFTDGSCQNNPSPTGAGSLVFKDGINNPPIKFGNAVSKFSTNYHGELEAILLSLKYIRTINLIGIKKVHIFTDSMSSIQAITSKKQQESFNDTIEEIKRISNELRTLNFAITHVFSHIDIKFNEEADKLAKVGVKLASKHHQAKELTISTAKKANKNHSIEIWGIRWARQSHAKDENIVPEINSASLKHRNLLQKITPAPFARKIFHLKTGHNLLPDNRSKIDKSINPLCPTCKKTFDQYHLFFSCHDIGTISD